jgi:addiction module HigA family antidote
MPITAGANRMRHIHPGEVLREDYLKPLGLSADALARIIEAPASLIDDIVCGRGAMTTDIATRLVRCFGGDVPSWMNLQAAYEIKVAGKELAKRIEVEVQPLTA